MHEIAITWSRKGSLRKIADKAITTKFYIKGVVFPLISPKYWVFHEK
jgi:hypothetical protein